MANLPETEDFAEGTYQIETSDRVLGGPGGIANKQAEQLGNRTAWLRGAIAKIVNGTTTVGKAAKLATSRTLRFKGALSGSGSYDGGSDTEITLTLADSGVAAGSYTKVTINEKGLATGGSNPTSLSDYGITDGVSKAESGVGSVPEEIRGNLSDLPTTRFVTVSNLTTDKPANVAYAAGVHLKFPGDRYGFDLISSINSEWFGLRRIDKDGNGTWRVLYHSGNFDPAGKADKATTLGGYGISDAYTKTETKTAIADAVAALVASSPESLDTLKELADALGRDPNFATTMTNALAAKAPLASPNFSGIPQVPTAPEGDNSAKAANTNFVYLAFSRLLVSATESIKGIARFASQAEVNAGADDNSIVTPKKLRSGFQIQLSVNGYIYFPSWLGGLVWQWGNRAFTSGATSTFTTPFPNEALIVWALPNSIVGGSPSTVAANVQSLNQQSMILSWTAGGTYNFFWFALGR